MTQSFRFAVPAIREHGSLSFTGDVPTDDVQSALEAEVVLETPLHSSFELTWRSGEVDYKGKVSGRWKMECNRCLAPCSQEYTAKVEGTLTPTGGSVDLTEDVRQVLVLTVPMQVHCRPDCKGLCPQCRADRNVKDCGCRT